MFLFVNGFALASISEILHCSVVDRRLQQGSIEKNNVVMQSTLFRIYSIRAPFLMELRKQDIARRCQLWYRKPLRSQSRSNASRNTDVRNSRIKTTCFYETMQPHWWQITFFFFLPTKAYSFTLYTRTQCFSSIVDRLFMVGCNTLRHYFYL